MSSDSTELHFVRCPSCRSLVPASSKTCRMCGAGLEAGGKADEPQNEGRRSGRVRQRTMSTSSDELNSAVHKIRDEMTAPGEAPAGGDSGESEDPLSAYIEEIESAEGANGEGQVKNGAPLKQSARAEQGAPRFGSSASEIPKPQAPKSGPAEENDSRPRVVVESGGRRKGGPGLSFGARPHEAEEPPMEEPAKPQVQFEGGSSGGDESGSDEAPPEPPRAQPAYVPPSRVTREEEPQEPRRIERREEPRPAANGQPQKQEQVRSYEIPRKNVVSGGRLAGWLVSFRDPDGKAIEIREGKFFVSRSRVKDSDLVIDDRSVSSPHALCAVGGQYRMRMQDLMSDNGVFVKRRDEHEYIRITETAELEHGDWIKFGDVEYNVCLISHVGEK